MAVKVWGSEGERIEGVLSLREHLKHGKGVNVFRARMQTVQPQPALQTKERVDQKEDGRASSQDPKGFKSHLK